MRRLLMAASLLAASVLASDAAASAPDPADVVYQPAAPWVLPPPATTEAATPAEAPYRLIYSDTQVHITSAGRDVFTHFRVKILKPDALRLGNLTVSWNPSGGAATVHVVRIIRGDQVIDVLKESKFSIIQRENGLEQAILTGLKTAALQVPGLQVGDELEFAATVRAHDITLGDDNFGLVQLPLQGSKGAFRYRFVWPASEQLSWRATPDLPKVDPVTADGQTALTYEMRDPAGVVVADGAVPRANIRRLVEFSDFGGWNDLSARLWPLFDQASKLTPGSPLHAEVAKIAAASSDPQVRATAALRLVQEQVRYVYIGLNGGNFRPASIDETWTRRFGDCKAKTVLLLALLRELGVEAEAVLANSQGGDGLDARLPSPALFDHVLVRARINGVPFWLDGTRPADRVLDKMPAPPFRWVLPLRHQGAQLELVPVRPPTFPQFIGLIDVDASAGFAKPAIVKATNIMRQDDAYALRSQLSALSPEDADRAVRGYWRQELDWVDPDQVSWSYDERNLTLTLSLTGKGTPEWKGDDTSGRALSIYGAGFIPPDQLKRPADQDQTAPWLTNFPRFRCWGTTIRLPAAGPKFAWNYSSAPMNLKLGGTIYWRAAGMKGNVVRTVMSRRVYLPELDARQAAAVNAGISSFNNQQSIVAEERVLPGTKQHADSALPFADDVDWSSNPNVCSAPDKTTEPLKSVGAAK
jgi:hypothetical protein